MKISVCKDRAWVLTSTTALPLPAMETGTHIVNRSRASSVSSLHNQGFAQPQGQLQRGYTPSSDFETMALQQQQMQQQQHHHSQSPSPGPGQYAMGQYPVSPPPSAGFPQKPQSPPALYIPNEPPQITHTGTPSPTPLFPLRCGQHGGER